MVPGGTGGTPLTNTQMASLRDSALNGVRPNVPGVAGIQTTGSGGVPTIADIIRAGQTRYFPYQG